MKKNRENILVVTYWGFKDALIQAYTLPYLQYILENHKQGTQLFLVTLEPGLTKKQLVQLKQSDELKELNINGIKLLPFRYFPFGIKMLVQWIGIFASLMSLIYKKKIKHIHTWCTPAGAAGYILSVITGRPLILDSFEPHAEPMLESNTWRKNSLAFRLLFLLENLQVKRAKGAIACVESMREYSIRKYGSIPPVFYHKPACVDLDKFSLEKAKKMDLLKSFGFEDKIICVYAGKFGGNYLERETFDFFKTAYDYWGDRFRVLLLSSHSDKEIEGFSYASNLPVHIVKKIFVPHSLVPDYIGLSDFGITPFVPVPSKRYGSPIKTGEYFAMGLPVVITRDISDDSDQVADFNAGYVLQSLDSKEYKNAVRKIDELLHEKGLAQRIRKVAKETRSFSIAKAVYKNFFDEIRGSN